MRRLTVVLLVGFAVAAGCGTEGRSSGANASGGDTGPARDASVPDVSDAGALACVGATEASRACPTSQPLRTDIRSIVDLRDPADAVAGRCDTWSGEKDGVMLSANAADYPLVIQLSQAGFVGPCGASCPKNATTAYGVAFIVPENLVHPPAPAPSKQLLVRVAAGAWRAVSGCASGEATACACLGGYQEYGEVACVASHGGGFGVATADPSAAPTEVYVDLVEGVPSGCCPYTCL